MSNSRRQLVVPEAKAALNRMKMEAAAENGITLNEGYNGNLTTREAGSIGGTITKRLVQMAEQSLSSR